MKIQRAILALSFVIGLSACENNTKERKSVATDTENHSRYTDDMMKNMRGVPLTENIDVDYAQVMKVHNEGALQMAVLEAKGWKR